MADIHDAPAEPYTKETSERSQDTSVEAGPGRRALQFLLSIGLISALSLSGLVVLSRGLGWQGGPLYSLVALTPYFGVLLLVTAVLAAWSRRWLTMAMATLLAGVVAIWWVPTWWPMTSTISRELDLQVMTVNMQFGRADPNAIAAAVRDYSVDLLSVQEITRDAAQALGVAGLDETLPYRVMRIGASPASGTAIYSRFPVTDVKETDGLIFENLAAQVRLPSEDRVTFLAMHPIPPTPTDGNRGTDIASATREFMNSSSTQAAIAAGDFNATRDNVPLRELADDGWTNAADGAGAGLLRTWPNDLHPIPPLVALDHVLSRGIRPAAEVVVIDVPGTDHRALVASL